MADTYSTISAPADSIFREKMSKFLAFAIPVTSAEEAKKAVAECRKKYFDARHVCWAYMIGSARTQFLSSDDGEPSGTAGKPILGQINSFGLTDIVVMVVRYFGGIKLGTSGLIAAYREAARSCLAEAQIIECHDMQSISFTFPYIAMEGVMRLAKLPGVDTLERIFDTSCSMTLSIRADEADNLRQRLADIDGLTFR